MAELPKLILTSVVDIMSTTKAEIPKRTIIIALSIDSYLFISLSINFGRN